VVTAFIRQNKLVAIFIVAFLIQAVLLLSITPEITKSFSKIYGLGFADDYDKLALNLAEGNGYRFYPDTAETLMREPGYPLFLAAVFKISGYSLQAARFANLVMAFGIAWLIAQLARRVSSSDVATLSAPLLFLFHPGIVVAIVRGSVEILFILLLIIFMVLLYRAMESGDRKQYFLAGGVLGLGILVRSTILLFPVFLAGYALFVYRGKRRNWKTIANIGILVLAMVMVMMPWVVRNYLVVNQFIPTASVQGVAAHAGQYICKNLSFENGFQILDDDAARERAKLASSLGYPFRDGYYQYFYSSKDEVAFNKFLLRKVVNEYFESPKLFLKCTTANLFNFWFAGKTWRVTGLNVIVQLPYLALFIVGACLAIRSGRGAIVFPMILIIIYLISVHSPIHAQARYSIPLVPFMSIFAGVVIEKLWERRKAGSVRTHKNTNALHKINK
jgi:4-amino-4-deoxy-L-arabinose transferase-like glycosyltransferase